MEKDSIRRLPNLSEEDRKIEQYFIDEACEKTEEYLQKYKNMPQSFGGRYICADLFKETFDIYSVNSETRNLYASSIHNSAAVLSNELFQRMAIDPAISKCIFLTGIPGAGKSFFVQSLIVNGELPKDTMVFEGDINALETIKQKMQKVLDNHKKIYVIVLNPTLELAYRNMMERLHEIGRGASMHTMARIASGLKNSLKDLYSFFNGNIQIGIYNKFSNADIVIQEGIENINTLEDRSYEEIKDELAQIREKIIAEENIKKNSLYRLKNERLENSNGIIKNS